MLQNIVKIVKSDIYCNILQKNLKTTEQAKCINRQLVNCKTKKFQGNKKSKIIIHIYV